MSTRRALLLGAPAPNLGGVEHDIELMQAALARHHFLPAHVRVVLPATRAAFAAGMRELIACVQPDDVAVVYYSGHGSKLVHDSHGGSIGEAADHRFLLLSDFESSSDDDFRGYTNTELSLDLDALTRITPNVVAIMDCCHAGRTFRSEDKQEAERMVWGDGGKGPPTRHVLVRGRWAQATALHYQRLLASRSCELDQRYPEANPHAVLLLASAADGVACETRPPARPDPSWRASGVMTRALHDALISVDPDHTTWQDLGRIVRQTPQRGTSQLVAIEGPYRRLLFRLEERAPLGDIDLDLSHGRIILAGGRLADVRIGDLYELWMPNAHGRSAALGYAQVSAVLSSHAELDTRVHFEQLGPGASARPLGYTEPRVAIELVGLEPNTPKHAVLCARLGASGYLRVIGSGTTTVLPVVARLHYAPEHRSVQLSGNGVAFDRPRSFELSMSPGVALPLADCLADAAHRLARAHMLRSLTADEGEQLESSWQLSVHRVEGGHLGPTLARRDRLYFGDAISLHLRSRSRVHLSALLIHADAKIQVLTRTQAGGVEVEAGEAGYVLGQRSGPTPALRGVELARPSKSSIAGPGPLPATLVIVISDGPVDLRSWEQPGITRFASTDVLGPESASRNITAPTPPIRAVRFHVETHEFELQSQDQS